MNNPLQMMQMLSQLKQNPMAMLSKRFNLPENLSDPNQIIQHLLNTNQVSQDQINQINQMKDGFKGLF